MSVVAMQALKGLEPQNATKNIHNQKVSEYKVLEDEVPGVTNREN